MQILYKMRVDIHSSFLGHPCYPRYLPDHVSCIPAISNEMNANTNNKLIVLFPPLLPDRLHLVGMVRNLSPLQLGDQDQGFSLLQQVLESAESHHS